MKKIIEFLMRPWTKYKQRKALAKRLEQLRKADPFIYK
jgi:hypothetical protein